MTRGVQEEDVWRAADALLLEGLRPTIERVRQKIGRGSPNTVSPYLETWFKRLGGRITDPRAFAATPDVPDPVLDAAKHFWETALSETRRDFDARLEAALADITAQLQLERDRAANAEAVLVEAQKGLIQAQSELSSLQEKRESDRRAAAVANARLEEARSRNDDLLSRLHQKESEASAALDVAKNEISLAQARSAAVERRVMLELDAERTARGKADKKVGMLELKLQATQDDLQAARSLQAEQVLLAKSETARLEAELTRVTAAHAAASEKLATLEVALEDARHATQVTSSQSELAERVIAAFTERGPKALRARRIPTKAPLKRRLL